MKRNDPPPPKKPGAPPRIRTPRRLEPRRVQKMIKDRTLGR